MPWYNSITGELVKSPSDDDKQRDELIYKPSIYAKEELPTWSEVYEEFYWDEVYTYDPENPYDQELDLYWKIPHKKFLVATVCNQFNKMLYEDGMMNEITKNLSDKLHTNVKALQFICGSEEHESDVVNIPNSFDKFFDHINEIYTIPLPTGKTNPFIVSNYHRVNINDLDGEILIYPVLKIINKSSTHIVDVPIIYTNEFDIVMDTMIKQFKDYFSGDIGWKDSEGNVIEGDPGYRDCVGAGYCTT